MNVLAVTCDNIKFIFRIIHYVINIMRWGVVIILIAMVTYDFFKGMIGKSEDEMRKATNTAFKRIIWAVVVFFVPVIIKYFFSFVGGSSSSNGLVGPADYIRCYNESYK
ncbi:MAG: hypothetical protein J6X02_02990 [Bacilli bacterium]|nr:hypothetical protein [Bacilli bacterium]